MVSPRREAAQARYPSEQASVELSQIVVMMGLNAIALLGAKTLMAFRDLSPGNPPPWIVDTRIVRSLARILACWAEDAALFVTLGAVVALLLQLFGPNGRRWLTRLAEVTAGIAAAFTVLTVVLYHEVRHFLTLPLLVFAGRADALSAVTDRLDIIAGAALLLLPFAVILGGRLTRATGFLRSLWPRFGYGTFGAIVLTVAGLALVSSKARTKWFFDSHSQFARNPHFFFLRSVLFADFPAFATSSDSVSVDPGWVPGNAAQKDPQKDGPAQNLVLVILESVGARYMSLYGSSWPTTPQLAEIAPNALVFDRFYATAPHTAASALTLFSSLYNDPRVAASILAYPSWRPPVVAEWLQQQGYLTVFLGGGWESGWGGYSYANLGDNFLARGFDFARDTQQVWANTGRIKVQLAPPSSVGYPDADAFEDAMRLMEALRSERFALILWTHDTHEPYPERNAPVEFDERDFPAALFSPPDHKANWFAAHGPERKEEFRRYLRNLWLADRMIGRLMDRLVSLGLDRNTVFVVTSDHGESFGQHGWFYHGFGGLYEEDLHTPLLIAHPQLTPGRASTLGSHVDLWPTLAPLMRIPASQSWQGTNLLGPNSDDDRRVYFARSGSVGLRERGFKFSWDYLDGRVSLFDLENDPAEATNLVKEHPELVQEYMMRVGDWVRFQSRGPTVSETTVH